MASEQITEIKRIFTSRLDVLEHLLTVAEKHVADTDALMQERLAEDMLPFGAQIVFMCNQPRGFSQWCAGEPVDNRKPELASLAEARALISETRSMVEGINVDDSKLDETKRLGLGPGVFCDLPGRQYVNDYLMPNLYFHITTTYAMLRKMSVPIGKADYMTFLRPYIQKEA